MTEFVSSIKVVQFEGKEVPINLLPRIDIRGYRADYNIYPFTFSGELGGKASGAFFDVGAWCHTAVAKIVIPGVRLIEKPISTPIVHQGKEINLHNRGWFLSIDPSGKITETYLDPEKPVTLEYGTGHSFCFVAKENGLWIQNFTYPPFRPEMEKIISENSDELPPAFWKKYHELTI